MFRLVVASCLALSAAGQYSSKEAKILKEQRYNAGDGRFGTAYAQEDGTISREETTIDGERIGQYSYIDNDGKTITVKWTAGIDGFRILEGDHVPTGATGLSSAAYNPDIASQGLVAHKEEQAAPAPARAARPVQRRRRPATRQQAPVREAPRAQPQFQPQQQQFQPQQQQFQPQQPQTNPFINPDDPTHRDLQFNTNAAQFQPQQPAQRAFQPQQRAQPAFQPQQFQQQQFQPQQQQQQRETEPFNPAEFMAAAGACAGCEDLSNFINPADPSHAALFNQQFQPQQRAQPAFQQQQFQPQQQQNLYRFQQPQQNLQPAFLQQPQRQQQFQPQQFQPQQQQQFQPQQQQQFQQQQFQPQQQQQQFRQQSAEELAHQRLGESQIAEAVRLQNCLASPGAAGC